MRKPVFGEIDDLPNGFCASSFDGLREREVHDKDAADFGVIFDGERAAVCGYALARD